MNDEYLIAVKTIFAMFIYDLMYKSAKLSVVFIDN
mgnify:CR=1 FL=1